MVAVAVSTVGIGTEVDVAVCVCEGATEAVRVEVERGVILAVGGVKFVAVEQDITMNNDARKFSIRLIKRYVTPALACRCKCCEEIASCLSALAMTY